MSGAVIYIYGLKQEATQLKILRKNIKEFRFAKYRRWINVFPLDNAPRDSNMF